MNDLASKELCEELYILTDWGKKFETKFYYDKHGSVLPYREVINSSKRTLPKGLIPAYDLGFLYRKLPLHEVPEDLLVRLCIELAKHNLYIG